jgi:TIGR00266 family protein
MPYAHEIDYKIYGDDLQFVEIELDPNETVIAEAGAMMMMEDGIQMETIFGDGSNRGNGSVMDKLFSAGKRVLTGESLFMTAYTNTAYAKKHASFAAPYAGKIIPVNLIQYNRKIICQKDAFLCAAKGVSVDIAFQKRLGVGFFGGEGFIMQKLEGDGLAFLHAGGTIVEKKLYPGEKLRIDTGCLVALTGEVDYNIEFIRGVKNAFFGGEGIFFATVTGPGSVWVQSLPFSRLADKVLSSAVRHGGGSRKDESGLFNMIGGIGNLLNGD